ncbi:hypothetical protein OG462_34425 [Streptomyces sp. NBC_01077]|uniref:hypothetical protein n=1 Tax=Streptomyces sp. NBC_01077 TaxID=2903746 RepID=UPI00386F7C3A|nr:hypothetical protein OG462_34425 [Streptomyces sp. NBC_01077]
MGLILHDPIGLVDVAILGGPEKRSPSYALSVIACFYALLRPLVASTGDRHP